MRFSYLVICFSAVWLSLAIGNHVSAQDKNTWWGSTVQRRLNESGDNHSQLIRSLDTVKYEHRRALEFLIEHMPQQDLLSIESDYLIENISLAYQAINQVPWGKTIPEEIFFNDILPYANIDEKRESWRKAMMDRCLPIIAGCKTPTEAALKLNRELFPLINVRYSTSRKKANQSPSESMEQSVASCTGLSIILTDACRSVGIPSRLAGVPSWTNKRGNHTWVEIWDSQWYFTGAAEPSDKLNQTWFNHDAAQADSSKPLNRIYAISYSSTGTHFPLVWSPESDQINAINVTERYTNKPANTAMGSTRVLVNIFDTNGKRVVRDLIVTDLQGKELAKGASRGEESDTNDILAIDLPINQKWKIHWTEQGTKMSIERSTSDQPQTIWDLRSK